SVFASRRRHTRFSRDCSSDVRSSDLNFNNTSHQIKIYDQYKSLKLQKNLNMDSGSHHINTSGLQNGLYFIELQNQHFSKVFKMRSEERRVGKECSSRYQLHH